MSYRSALLLIFIACHPDPPAQKPFPYTFTPEADLPVSETVRAEGTSSLELFTNVVPYYQKYFEKKVSAPVEELAYFDAQRALWSTLEHDAPGTGPRLAMVGDVMWIRDQWDSFLGDDVKRELASYAGLFGNLETPIARSQPVPTNASDFLTYNADPGLVRSFRGEHGSLFSALSVANNHTFDQKDDGARETLAFLGEEGIASSGVRASKDAPSYAVVTTGGFRIGYYATTWGFNDGSMHQDGPLSPNALAGIAPEDPGATAMPAVDLSGVEQALAAMDRDHVDLKIVSAHWGHEYELYPTPVTMQIARRIVGLGADVIIGAHPHVQQPNEVCAVNGYASPTSCKIDAPGRARKALVIYSLGNFATNMWGFLHELGVVTSIELVRDANGATDWRAPRHVFVHNARPPRAKARRLELLSTYLDGRCGGAGCTDATMTFAAFAERHLTGVHLDESESAQLRRLGAAEGRSLDDEIVSFASSLGFDAIVPRMLSALEEDARP